MPGDDYSATISGGLKLKGVNGSSKITKHKKKKPKPQTDPATTDKSKDEPSAPPTQDARSGDDSTERAVRGRSEDRSPSKERDEDLTPPPRAGRTEAEIRHEERRRKRLDERLKREGTKTHKERVEELNRYLSNLSEHHDMPRIGPG